MKITRIRVYQTLLPYRGGVYAWGAGNRIETAISIVVVIDTDSGLMPIVVRPPAVASMSPSRSIFEPLMKAAPSRSSHGR